MREVSGEHVVVGARVPMPASACRGSAQAVEVCRPAVRPCLLRAMTMDVGNSAGDLGLPARWCICHRGGMSNSGGRRSWMPWHRAGRQAAETTVHVAEVWHVRLNQQPRRDVSARLAQRSTAQHRSVGPRSSDRRLPAGPRLRPRSAVTRPRPVPGWAGDSDIQWRSRPLPSTIPPWPRTSTSVNQR
jgi:hypothetical protein